LIERLIAFLLMIVGGIIIAITLNEKKSRSVGRFLGFSAIAIGVAIGVDYFYSYPLLLVYAVAIAGFAIIAGTLYLVFRSPVRPAST